MDRHEECGGRALGRSAGPRVAAVGRPDALKWPALILTSSRAGGLHPVCERRPRPLRILLHLLLRRRKAIGRSGAAAELRKPALRALHRSLSQAVQCALERQGAQGAGLLARPAPARARRVPAASAAGLRDGGTIYFILYFFILYLRALSA